RTHVEAGGVGAVLAHVRGHQPAEAIGLLVGLDTAIHRTAPGRRLDQRRALGDVDRELLLDERHVSPPGGIEFDAVVVGVAGVALDRHRDLVPLLAGHLARLATNTHRGVGEEAHPGLGLLAVAARPGDCLELSAQSFTPARWRYSSTSCRRSRPR